MRGQPLPRRGDASDATVEVLREQLARSIDAKGWERVDTSGDVAAAAEAWAARR